MDAAIHPLPAEADQWAALRCQSVQTLALADSLIARGVPGWSPRVAVRVRVPRKRKTELRTVPLLPSFVFVPFPFVDAAVDLGRSGVSPHSWPFLFNGDRPAIPSDQLVEMQHLGPRKMADLFKPGDRVRFVVGPLHGLTGTVLARKGRDKWAVEVDAGRRVLVPSFLLAALGIKPPAS